MSSLRVILFNIGLALSKLLLVIVIPDVFKRRKTLPVQRVPDLQHLKYNDVTGPRLCSVIAISI